MNGSGPNEHADSVHVFLESAPCSTFLDAAVRVYEAIRPGFPYSCFGVLVGSMRGESARIERVEFGRPAIAGCAYDDSGHLVDAGHPGAIEREEFVELQKSLAESKTADKTPAYDYLLSGGLSKCGNCEQELSGARTNAGNPGYRCRPKEKDGRGGCGTVRIDALLLETHVAEYVVPQLSKPGVRAQIERAGRRVAKQAEEFREEIQGLEKRRTDLAGPYARGEIRLDAFKAADQEITGQVKALRSRLRYAEQMASFSLGGVKDLVRWWNHAPFGSKRALAMLLLEKVEVFSARDRGVREIEPGRVKLHWRKLS
ncbi:zinc ribbon domain-containing protein [Streptomyces sp. V1I1]|uniref:zinc ribbon domain-containing protein n=1 Tax=Streptomyces sp. V1I1 TaxID=3042272 RepID=UPI002789EB82|nr:zinc ribbon domain-containing protein [Streptomyces sp. V1I1]MDQ0945792.1 hypothetical protein [Streptomyces sp. V1I1]